MARHQCELFGVVLYGPDLSYQALYELEQQFIDRLREILEGAGAVHLDFWGAGDALQLQCSLGERDKATLHDICDEATAMLTGELRGRLVCVDKDLTAIDIFHLFPGNWEQEKVEIGEEFYRRSFQGRTR